MAAETEIDTLGIAAYLDQYGNKDLLRLLTCGSVDDGKSTLIGRLLYDAGAVFDDQLSAAEKDSKKFGTTGDDLDFALLVDGLEAEREQGITIDVAYRYFTTSKRKFIIADTPGHEQYTRNMATGASTADLAIILVDARSGVVEQTRRHAFIASLLGIKHLVVAINKMDLVGYDETVFDDVRTVFSDFAAKLQISDLHFIPLSARFGDNVVSRSKNMPWYRAGPLLDLLESVHIASDRNLIDLRFSVQQVVRPNLDFRGYAGTVLSGILRTGDAVVALPSGRRSRIASIVDYAGERDSAFAPMTTTVTLTDEIDVSRGDTLVSPNNAPTLDSDFEAMVVWMTDQPLKVDRQYLLKHAATQTSANISAIRYRMNIATLGREPAETLSLNEIGRVSLSCNRPLAFDSYQKNRSTGAFILIDRLSNATVAAGMIVAQGPTDKALSRRTDAADAGSNIQRQRSQVSAAARTARLTQKPLTIWLTGLPRSGKSSLAFALENALFERDLNVHVLDGENLRFGISSDLGFSVKDRWENQRRAAEIAKLCGDVGLITIVALVSPLSADRAQVRRIVGGERFVEVFCNAPLAVCEQRDPSGLYERARLGEIDNFTGVDAPYESPDDASIILDTATRSAEENLQKLLDYLAGEGWLASV